MSKSLILKIKETLENSKFRFSNYQEFPTFLIKKYPELSKIEYTVNQINLDQKRYEWLLKNLPEDKYKNICEIGANIGFQSISFAYDFRANIDCFETNTDYANLIFLISKLIKLDPLINSSDKSINLENISNLNHYDLIINLNVLHHAGCIFDTQHVKKLDDWFDYSEKYLNKLLSKSKYLFFQSGNMQKGKAIFPSEKSIEYLKKIIIKSGWKILSFGVIKNLELLDYESFNYDQIDEVNLFKCRRNSYEVDYFFNEKFVKSLETGLAQRPLWLCVNPMLK